MMVRKNFDSQTRRRGAFYTPEDITEQMASLAIDARLLERFNAKASRHYASISEAIKDGTPKDIKVLADALVRIRVLDPACGDGAFLLSCQEHLTSIWDGCLIRIGRSAVKALGRASVGQFVVTHNLFGVDVDAKAVEGCRKSLARRAGKGGGSQGAIEANVRHGNSLLGYVIVPGDAKADPDKAYLDFLSRSIDAPYMKELQGQRLFHWSREFPKVMGSGCFDVIIGNPPYGDEALSHGERAAIRASYSLGTTTSDWQGKGSANPMSVFIERSYDILASGGQLALILPSSLARVKEFQRTRRFLMDHMAPWRIVDEGSAFKGVTLEMLTLFARKGPTPEGHDIEVSVRRAGTSPWKVPAAIFRRFDRFMLYWDCSFGAMTAKAEIGLLAGRRGPTVPNEKRSQQADGAHPVPLLVSGKGVHRYRLVPPEFVHAREDALASPEAKAIHGATLLVGARLMDHYRVCVKPPGLLVGDNVVRIDFDPARATPETLCVVLNSSLMHYIVRRYLFNESRLTMFIQSVTEATPLRLPRDMELFTQLGRLMLALGQAWPDAKQAMDSMDRCVLDPLVYELYLLDGGAGLAEAIRALLPSPSAKALPLTRAETLLRKVAEDRTIRAIVGRIRSEAVVGSAEAAIAAWKKGA